jgi:hypothetical protein
MFYLLGVSSLTERLGGYLLLDANFLTEFWTYATNLPVLALADLNNTLVAGGLALSIFFCLPLYLLSWFVYVKFIVSHLHKIQESKIAKRIKSYKFVNKLITKMDVIRSKTKS